MKIELEDKENSKAIDMPKVSIIIPNYNKGNYIMETVNSALEQTYKNIEIVIIDDASTDNSVSIINDLVQKNSNIKLIRNDENKGVVYSRNKAIDEASGEYILPLDSDDTIEATYIEKAVEVLKNDSQIGIVYCRAKFINNDKEWELLEYNKKDFFYENLIFCSALFRKEDFYKVGKYKKYAEQSWEDWDLWLSLIESGLKPYRINEFLFNYRKCEQNSRNEIENIDIVRCKKIIIKNHIDYYLNESTIIDDFWNINSIKTKKDELEKKHIKYKRLFNYLLPITVIELALIVCLLIVIAVVK